MLLVRATLFFISILLAGAPGFALVPSVTTIANITTTAGITPAAGHVVSSMEECVEYYNSTSPRQGLIYCNATYDSFLCWPPTEAGSTAYQHCPAARLSDTSRLAFRRCGLNGLWLGRRKNESSARGWTNYTPCFPAEVQDLFGKVYDDSTDPQIKFSIARYTRYMEIFGFSTSLVALLISLFIFYYFRKLHNTRTLIHRQCFLSMLQQVVVRLVVYLDHELSDDDPKSPSGLMNMPYVCEGFYILLEYSISSMFSWMFIEGLHLHIILTANSMGERDSLTWHYLGGWGLPVINTVLWAVMTNLHYQDANVQQCWYGYNFLWEYWFVQGPRMVIIAVNCVFLINILRVLVHKLQENQNSEFGTIRKAAKAAMVLVPLLGITNSFYMMTPPLDGSLWTFGLWSFSTHFLRSFQGFFVALIYCFLNDEVQQVLRKQYNDWQTLRKDQKRIREAACRRRQRLAAHADAGVSSTLEWVQSNGNEDIEMDTRSEHENDVADGFADHEELNEPSIRVDDTTNVTDES